MRLKIKLSSDFSCPTNTLTQLGQTNVQKKEPTWADVGKEIATTALPFLQLYKPLSFPVSIVFGGLRIGTSLLQLKSALEQGDTKEVPRQLLATTIAVAGLAGTLFAHPLGMLITTAYDMVMEVEKLCTYIHRGEYARAIESCLKILSYTLFFAVLIHGGPELMIAYLAAQIIVGLLQAREDFANGRYIAGIGHALMASFNVKRLVDQVRLLQAKQELMRYIENFSVGKLGEKWQFPSDHLPVGAKVGNAHVISWNILNKNYMQWVTEQDSQGLNGSMITELHEKPSAQFEGLTQREDLVIKYLGEIMTSEAHSSHLILTLQECSPELIAAVKTVLPSNMGIVSATGSTGYELDYNSVIYNKETFKYNRNESTLAEAFPTTSPKRLLMDLSFEEKATHQKYQVINAHLPGDPENPGTFDFANYILTHAKEGSITIGVGDMNFTEQEMQAAFDLKAAEQGIPSSFRNLTDYNTNIGAFFLEPKSIDHIWVNTNQECAALKPNEILNNLQSTVDLLYPHEMPEQKQKNE